MESLIIYPENKEQLIAVKAFMKAMKISYEQYKPELPDYVVEGINKSLEEVKSGNTIPYTGIKDMLDLS